MRCGNVRVEGRAGHEEDYGGEVGGVDREADGDERALRVWAEGRAGVGRRGVHSVPVVLMHPTTKCTERELHDEQRGRIWIGKGTGREVVDLKVFLEM